MLTEDNPTADALWNGEDESERIRLHDVIQEHALHQRKELEIIHATMEKNGQDLQRINKKLDDLISRFDQQPDPHSSFDLMDDELDVEYDREISQSQVDLAKKFWEESAAAWIDDQLPAPLIGPRIGQQPSFTSETPIDGSLAVPQLASMERERTELNEGPPPTDVENNSLANALASTDVFDEEQSGDQSQISDLKKQLEDKLRAAEVDISIQRARVLQQKAELDEMKQQLERREAAIRESVNTTSSQNDAASRWNRHFERFRRKRD